MESMYIFEGATKISQLEGYALKIEVFIDFRLKFLNV